MWKRKSKKEKEALKTTTLRDLLKQAYGGNLNPPSVCGTLGPYSSWDAQHTKMLEQTKRMQDLQEAMHKQLAMEQQPKYESPKPHDPFDLVFGKLRNEETIVSQDITLLTVAHNCEAKYIAHSKALNAMSFGQLRPGAIIEAARDDITAIHGKVATWALVILNNDVSGSFEAIKDMECSFCKAIISAQHVRLAFMKSSLGKLFGENTNASGGDQRRTVL